MTMKIRIINESAKTNYEAHVRVYNCAKHADHETKEKSESVAESLVLAVGESAEFFIHSNRHVTVEEVLTAL